jgi:hypothetical protein
MPPSETSPEAHRALGPSGRLQAAIELSDLVRKFALAGFRHRHPDWSDEQLLREFMQRLYVPS